MMTRAGALKAWETRRAKVVAIVPVVSIAPVRATPTAGRLTDYAALLDGELFFLLRSEQVVLERFANNPARGGFARGVEGSGVGCIAVISGGTFAGGRASLMARYAIRRLERIEAQLDARGFDREVIDAHRFGEVSEQAHREGMMLDAGDTSFDELEASA